MKSFLEYLHEGGALKGPSGEVSTPISTKDRHGIANDILAALSAIHDQVEAHSRKSIYGKNRKALSTGSAFSGSSAHLVNSKISDMELHKVKPTMGDIDTQVDKDVMSALASTLQAGQIYGAYTLSTIKKHGNEISVLLTNPKTKQHHQIDFEGVEYSNNEPTEFESFAHSSNWEDNKNGIKGAAHKQLLNEVGLESHKFSITHGLNVRVADPKAKATAGEKDQKQISIKLFGKECSIKSFEDVANAIKKYTPQKDWQAIITKFAERGQPEAVARLKNIIGVSLKEAVSSHSCAVTIPTGLSPVSHVGHQDLVDAMLKFAPVKDCWFSLSDKAGAVSGAVKLDILKMQSPKGINFVEVSGAGVSIRKAYDALPEGKKVLHLFGGEERQGMLDGLKKSLEQGKIKEMGALKFDAVELHNPESKRRTTSNGHPTSGTNLRIALHSNDERTIADHLGAAYSKKLSTLLKKLATDGHIPINRKLV